ISTTAADVDLLTPGLQVFEGSTLPIKANVSDDVQVRNVELLVNGQVVQNQVSFPFDFSAIAPSIATAGGTFTIQVRATDTGGNVHAPHSLDLRNDGRLVELAYPPLPAGTYQLVINGTAVTDRIGQPLSRGNVTDSFTLTPRETLTVTNPDADPATPGLQLYE